MTSGKPKDVRGSLELAAADDVGQRKVLLTEVVAHKQIGPHAQNQNSKKPLKYH